jgi:hypothetical protein
VVFVRRERLASAHPAGDLIELTQRPAEGRGWREHLNLTGRSAGRPLLLAVLAVAFLPYDARISAGAIVRSGLRMVFTRRGLLLWQLPSYARRNARRTPSGFFREMGFAPALAAAIAVALAMAGKSGGGMACRRPHPAALAALAGDRLVDQPAADRPHSGPERRSAGLPAGSGPAHLALFRGVRRSR